jgi:hypothetical protein
VLRTEAGEVPAVGGEQPGGTDPLGSSGDCGIDEAEWQIGVLTHQLGGTHYVGGIERLERELAGRDRTRKRRLGAWTQAAVEEVRQLGKDCGGHQHVFRGAAPPVAHPRMPGVVAVEQRVQRTGIGQGAHRWLTSGRRSAADR